MLSKQGTSTCGIQPIGYIYLTMYITLDCLSSTLLFISLESWKVGNINTIAILQVTKMQFAGAK